MWFFRLFKLFDGVLFAVSKSHRCSAKHCSVNAEPHAMQYLQHITEMLHFCSAVWCIVGVSGCFAVVLTGCHSQFTSCASLPEVSLPPLHPYMLKPTLSLSHIYVNYLWYIHIPYTYFKIFIQIHIHTNPLNIFKLINMFWVDKYSAPMCGSRTFHWQTHKNVIERKRAIQHSISWMLWTIGKSQIKGPGP